MTFLMQPQYGSCFFFILREKQIEKSARNYADLENDLEVVLLDLL
jgi:hypothetical protein